MPKKEAQVNTPITAVETMRQCWRLVEALLGGTKRMREESGMVWHHLDQKDRPYLQTGWLPQEPGESDEAYRIRRDRSVLFNAYSDTLRNVSERPFAEPITLRDDSAPELTEFVDDVDGNGRDITEFSRPVFQKGVHHGLTGVLVDFPQAPPGLTLAQERELGLRPYWTHIPFSRILGWRWERFNGEATLTQLRFEDDVLEPDGQWGEKLKQRVKVYTRRLPSGGGDPGETSWIVYEKQEDKSGPDEWMPVDQGVVSINVIPFAVFYTNRKGFMEGSPSLEDLAWKNLEHFQSSSEQRHILRYARAPLLYAAGVSETEMKGRVELGASRLYRFKNPQAKLDYAVHDGSGIDQGFKDLDLLEDQMTLLGLKPLLSKRPGGVTATSDVISQTEDSSELQSWVRAFEDFIEVCFAFTLLWLDVSDDAAGRADVCDRFTLVADQEEVMRLIELRKIGDISRETLWEALKIRGLLGDEFDTAEENRRLARELLEAGGDDDDDEEDED